MRSVFSCNSRNYSSVSKLLWFHLWLNFILSYLLFWYYIRFQFGKADRTHIREEPRWQYHITFDFLLTKCIFNFYISFFHLKAHSFKSFFHIIFRKWFAPKNDYSSMKPRLYLKHRKHGHYAFTTWELWDMAHLCCLRELALLW